ncbi:Leukotoxin export ATP-binding protein LtxB [Thalassocella blandensis]|nr:Leukotoxin export ATP-binding protein LtxB [Thalassocella blandensis]
MNKVRTKDIIDKIVQGDSNSLREYSHYAGALMPLLVVLDSNIKPREIAESLPYYDFEFDLSALLSILARLGYKSDIKNIKKTIPPEFAPCLFETSSGELYVIYKIEGSKCIYYDVTNDQTKFDDLNVTGKAYILEKNTETVAESLDGESWFWTLSRRFKSLTKQLLGISFVLNLTTLSVPLFVMFVYDSVIAKKNLDVLPMLVIGIALVLGVDVFLRMIRSRILALPAGRLEYLLSTESLKQILSLPSAMTERSSVTLQLSRLRLYDSIREFFTGPTALLALELPFIPIYLFTLYFLGGTIVTVPLLLIAALVLIGLFMLPKLKLAMDQAAKSRNEKEQILLETLNGVSEIKAMAEEEGWMRRIREVSAKSIKSTLSASQMQMIASNITQSLNMIAAVIVLGMGASKVMTQEISIGALIAIMAILWRVTGPIQSVFMAYVQFDQIKRGIRGLDDLMLLKKERVSDLSSLHKREYKGKISFERVFFRYHPQSDPVLTGANFDIEENELVVIAGENGSGKSTIMKLLCGMYYAQSGNILIDGTDIRQLNVNELRRVIGYVPQHPRLFTGNILSNLRLSDILATDEQLIESTKHAGIYKDIMAMKNGFKTKMGERAATDLSSSLQRGICIARAFLRDSPILLFDEPGATQDKNYLNQFLKQIQVLKGKKTIVIISHIPQIIKAADKVIVMERGTVKKVVTNNAIEEDKKVVMV